MDGRSKLRRRSGFLCVAVGVLFCARFVGQNVPLMPPKPIAVTAAPPVNNEGAEPVQQLICPGGFPTDLTVLNCSYTGYQRRLTFVSGSLTDQAILLAATGSLVSSAFPSTNSNAITLRNYGLNVAGGYVSSVARGGAEYFVGSLMRDDPRHVSCVNDPRVFYPLDYPPTGGGDPKRYLCTSFKRFMHAVIDSFTVRESQPGLRWLRNDEFERLSKGEQERYLAEYRVLVPHLRRRLFAFDRLIGVYAGAYAQYPFEPADSNSFARVSERAALSFGTTVLGSFYTEYASSIFRHHSKTPGNENVTTGRAQ